MLSEIFRPYTIITMLTSAVIALCATINIDAYVRACTSTYQAVSIQYSIDENIHEFTKKYEEDALKRIGDRTAGALAMAYNLGIKKEIKFSTGKVPFVQRTVFTIHPTSADAAFLWEF